MSKSRVVIDMYALQSPSRFRGIGRYCINYVKSLIKINEEDFEIVLLLNGCIEDSFSHIKAIFLDLIPYRNIKLYALPLKHNFDSSINYQIALEYLYNDFVASIEPDIYFCLSPFEGLWEDYPCIIPKQQNFTRVAIVYDFIPLIFKKEYLADSEKYKFYFERLSILKTFDHLFAISATTANDALKYLDFDQKDITVIYAGIDEEFINITNEINNVSIKNDEKYILYCGNIDARKNIRGFLKAYSSLSIDFQKQYKIAFTHLSISSKEFVSLLGQNNIGSEQCLFFGHVNDIELKYIYSSAHLVCMPSLYEGFGLPILEALYCDSLIIAGDNSSLREILELPDLLFDASDYREIAKSIEKYSIISSQERSNLIARAKKFIQKFKWDSTALLSIDVLRSLTVSSSKGHYVSAFMPERLSLECNRKARWLNKMSTDNQRVILDVSNIVEGDARTGIQRVVKNVANYIRTKGDVVFVSLLKNEMYHTSYDGENFVREEFRLYFRPSDVLYLIDSSWLLVKEWRSNVVIGKKLGVKVVGMFYDLIPVTHPGFCVEPIVLNFKLWLDFALEEFDSFICISKSTADSLIEYYNCSDLEIVRKTIYYSHLGFDPAVETYSNKVLELDSFFASRPTFLMVGTIEPRKGHELVFRTFKKLWDQNINCNLCIIGKAGWNVEELVGEWTSDTDHFKWIDQADDKLLTFAYRYAIGLIAASEIEGFGLPIIEAINHGTPIIASNIEVFREVGKERLFYFDLTISNLELTIKHFLSLSKEERVKDIKDFPIVSWDCATDRIMGQLEGVLEPYDIIGPK